MEDFQNKFCNLQIDGNLSEINEYLNTLNPEDIADILNQNNVQLSSVLACVENVGSEKTTVACDLLSLCLSSLDLDKDSNILLLDDMIKHENESVKVIGLTQLERLVKKHPEQKQSSSIILDVIACLDLANTSVGTLAMKVLSLQLLQHFDSPDVRAAIDSAGGTSSTAKCRVYELIVGISLTSPQNMRRVENILDRIIVDLSRDDVLLQLNVMEILSQLVATDYGLDYLEEQGLFPRLMTALENIDLISILFPGFIKFFASVANSHPQKIFTKYSHICKPLIETIISNDSSTLSPCLETLGVLGRSKEGKIGLSGLNLVCPDGDMKMVLLEMGMFLTTLPTEEQKRILNCLELLFTLEASSEEEAYPDNRICSITESWYKYLDRGPGLKVILGYCRNPFPDIKLAGFGVLRAIVEYPWGKAAVAETAGLLEYILDRGAEFNTEALQAKYEILRCLHNSNDNSFSDAQKTEIKEYVAKGPFYKRGITEVAVDDGQ